MAKPRIWEKISPRVESDEDDDNKRGRHRHGGSGLPPKSEPDMDKKLKKEIKDLERTFATIDIHGVNDTTTPALTQRRESYQRYLLYLYHK